MYAISLHITSAVKTCRIPIKVIFQPGFHHYAKLGGVVGFSTFM
ncbi:hypothetical protein [Paenibacillus lautus]|nr:hypothetical protein [Paenibacillus lautus]MEC0253757.1 hypothetical protein [Paenibacillus lautus]